MKRTRLRSLLRGDVTPYAPTIAVLLFCTFCRCFCYDFAVQPHPIEFSAVPQSRRVVEGDRVRLTCNFSVTRLGSNYPEPHIVWRKNGTHTQRTDKGGYSELVLAPVMPHHAGYYECLAVDGKRKKKFDPLGDGRYVTSSPRAYLDVVFLENYHTGSGAGSVLELNGTETVTLLQGEPALIPCDVSFIATPSHTDWYRNGTLLNNEILSNGSLLLLSASTESLGSYQCIVWFGNKSLEGPLLEIDVLEDPYLGAPQLVMDPATATLTSGDRLSITCYVTGIIDPLSSLQVQVARDDQVFLRSSSLDTSTGYKHFYAEETGRYECQLLRNGSIISRASTTITSGLVATSEDETVFFGDIDLSLVCGDATEGYDSIYWYGNGDLLQSGDTTHHLVGDSANLTGVYQCFKLMSGGMLYQHTWRVFEKTFTNPPTNLTCKVKFSEAYYPWPLVEMRWDAPDFIAFGEVRGYIVFSDNGLHKDKVVTNVRTEIELNGIDDIETAEEVYGLFVKIDRLGRERQSAPARCDFTTVNRAMDPPLPFKTTCPIVPSESVIFKWTNPLAAQSFQVYIQQIGMEAICLYGNHSLYRYSWFYDQEDDFLDFDDGYYDHLSPEQADFDLILTTSDSTTSPSGRDGVYSIPTGAACVATGSYLLDHSVLDPATTRRAVIPPAICVTQPSVREEDVSVRLGLECSGGVVDMTWNTSITSFQHTANITLHTACLNSQKTRDEVFSAADVSYAGSESVSGMYILCTFYGWFTDTRTGSELAITPAQCYMDQPSDSEKKLIAGQVYPPVIVPNSTVYELPPIPSTTLLTGTQLSTTVPLTTKPPTTRSSSMLSAPTSTPPSASTTASNTPSALSNAPGTTVVLKIAIPSGVGVVVIICILLLIVVLCCRQTTHYNIRHLHFLVNQELDKEYRPFNPDSMDDGVSLKTIFDDGEDWGQSSPPSEAGLAARDIGSSAGSTTEETSKGLQDEETPVISLLITEATLIAEDSGCDLQFEPYPVFEADDNHGKRHLFTKFLTGIDKETSPPPPPPPVPHTETTIEKGQVSLDMEVQRPLGSTSLTIADMVAHRMLVGTESGAPSSGYGTTDGYKYSTDASEINQDYLERKLQDVEETELDSTHDSLGIEIGSEDITPAVMPDQTPAQDSNRGPDHLPSFLLSLPQTQTDATRNSIPNLSIINSASTGDISNSGSYYRDNEGYLHMAPLQADLIPRHHQSSDTLV